MLGTPEFESLDPRNICGSVALWAIKRHHVWLKILKLQNIRFFFCKWWWNTQCAPALPLGRKNISEVRFNWFYGIFYTVKNEREMFPIFGRNFFWHIQIGILSWEKYGAIIFAHFLSSFQRINIFCFIKWPWHISKK